MKTTLLCFLFILIVCASWTDGTHELPGKYMGGFGGTFILRKDSTFLYEWRFDLMYSWSRGTWKSDGNVISFRIIPVYDTLTLDAHGAHPRDSVYLSPDSVSERLNQSERLIGSTRSQGTHPFPAQLIYQKDRLYPIGKNGQPDNQAT